MKPDDLAQRIGQLVADGQKIEAIKLVREATGAGLAEAKQIVEALEQGKPIPLELVQRAAARAAGDVHVPDEVRDVALAGDRIRAIHLLRERFGLGLKDGKDLLDREVPVPAGSRRGCLLPLLFGCAVGWFMLAH
jgi:ribosomal protein L7/L12